MSLEKYQEIIQLVDKVERADTEFEQDLWLIAERVLLKRLTGTYDKGSRLNSTLQAINRIKAESEQPPSNQIESTKTDYSDNTEDGSNLASGFFRAVELLEGMDSAKLYRLISWLRDAGPVNSVPAVETISRANEGALNEAATHIVFIMSRSGFRSMQNTLYDKFGSGASAKLYDIGERYGNKIASAFKARGLRLDQTIREIEKTVQFAGWGEIHFHRVSEREVECVIKNTIFSFEREGMKCSCYFAAGLLDGIISSLLYKQHRFTAKEIECVVSGYDSCKFSISNLA
jgi:predicted hydrocarbon binding protein